MRSPPPRHPGVQTISNIVEQTEEADDGGRRPQQGQGEWWVVGTATRSVVPLRKAAFALLPAV